MNTVSKLISGVVLASLAGVASAGRPVSVSEPDTLALLGVAGVIAAVAAIRRWRK